MSKLTDLVTTPIYEDVLPSTGKPIKFRPFVVREERALLMAQESEDSAVMFNTLAKVVNDCIVGPVPSMSTFDTEYMFIKIRIKSVEENSVLSFTCEKCEEQSVLSIPLKSVYVHKEEGHSLTIKLDETMAVVMKYPSIADITKEDSMDAVAAAMQTIYIGDTVLDASEFTMQELIEFIDTKLSGGQFRKLKEFFETIPEVRIDVDWKCPKCGNDHKQVLKGLNSFF